MPYYVVCPDEEDLCVETFKTLKKAEVRAEENARSEENIPVYIFHGKIKKVYEEEYGQFGGNPFGALMGDFYFDHSRKRVRNHGNSISFPSKTISSYYWKSISIHLFVGYQCYSYTTFRLFRF